MDKYRSKLSSFTRLICFLPNLSMQTVLYILKCLNTNAADKANSASTDPKYLG